MTPREFDHSEFFVFRTALLPFEDLIEWSAGQRSSACWQDQAALATAWASDWALLRDRLRSAVQQPEIREAIFLASPDLEARMQLWLRAPAAPADDLVLLALARYYSRMGGRSTPFGLFAGSSVGSFGAEPGLRLQARAHYQRHTRLDMDYLSALAAGLRADATLRCELTYRPNSSAHVCDGRLRYTEARIVGRDRKYHLVAVDLDESLVTLLECAHGGATRESLATALVADDISLEEATAYVDELIAAQVLVTSLEPPVTGREALPELLDTLRATPAGRRWMPVLETAHGRLQALDAEGLGNDPQQYRELASALAPLPAQADLARLFQVDLVKPSAAATLPPSLLDDASTALEILLRLHADVIGRENEAFTTFRQQFAERYGEREVPLLEALDEETGIGFMPSAAPSAEASPLLNGLQFPGRQSEVGRQWTLAHAFILPRLGRALAAGEREIVLGPEDLAALPAADFSRLPDALSVMLKVITPGGKALAAGEYRVLVDNSGGPSGARLLGRFCHMDGELCSHVRRHLREEEALVPEAVFAEIVHLPEGRIGNVLARPVLRCYEIPFLGRSGAAPECHIPLQDLRICVAGNRIVLRSERLGREIIPRMSTAHNYQRRTMGIYLFLCKLQTQYNSGGAAWNWGPLERLPFLPAIRSGRVLIDQARWYLDRPELQLLAAARDAARFAAVQRLRVARQLPRWVGLADGDNILPIDLDNAVSVAMFVDLVEKRTGCVLREMESSPETLFASGPEGHFVHEIVLPLVRRSRDTSSEARARRRPIPRAAPAGLARHGPGSEWLYYKLYAGTAAADGILRDELPALLHWCNERVFLDRWFFIRYGDPKTHLRVRLRAPSPEARAAVRARAEEMFGSLLAGGGLWRLQLDTYDPEQARYGGPAGIDLSERVFQADSEAVLQVLALVRGDPGAAARWQLCLQGMDRLLEDFGFPLAVKHRIALEAAAEFGREFSMDGPLKRQIRDRYRSERATLERLVAGSNDIAPPLLAGNRILSQRSSQLAPVVESLRAAGEAGCLEQPLEHLAALYLHLHANRMFRAAARAQEMILYHFLERLYDSQRARTSRQEASPGPAAPNENSRTTTSLTQ